MSNFAAADRQQGIMATSDLVASLQETIVLLQAMLRALEESLAQEERALRATSPQDPAIGQRNERLYHLLAHLHHLLEEMRVARSYLDMGIPLNLLAEGKGQTQARIMEAQESERRRLAREIHDGPAQVLANAIFSLQYCRRLLERDVETTKEELAHLEANLRQGLTEVRHLIFDLHVPSLSELGLEAALRQYLQNYQDRFGINVRLDLKDLQARLPATLEFAVFRIIQESLQNVYKHANASQVTVTSYRRGSQLVFTVADNGRGFDLRELPTRAGRHLGLVGMRERAALINGFLKVDSQPGKGTTITLIVPVPEG